MIANVRRRATSRTSSGGKALEGVLMDTGGWRPKAGPPQTGTPGNMRKHAGREVGRRWRAPLYRPARSFRPPRPRLIGVTAPVSARLPECAPLRAGNDRRVRLRIRAIAGAAKREQRAAGFAGCVQCAGEPRADAQRVARWTAVLRGVPFDARVIRRRRGSRVGRNLGIVTWVRAMRHGDHRSQWSIRLARQDSREPRWASPERRQRTKSRGTEGSTGLWQTWRNDNDRPLPTDT
jgi:hypothetical protein